MKLTLIMSIWPNWSMFTSPKAYWSSMSCLDPSDLTFKFFWLPISSSFSRRAWFSKAFLVFGIVRSNDKVRSDGGSANDLWSIGMWCLARSKDWSHRDISWSSVLLDSSDFSDNIHDLGDTFVLDLTNNYYYILSTALKSVLRLFT